MTLQITANAFVCRDFKSSDADNYYCRIATPSGMNIVEFQIEVESDNHGDYFSILVILLPTFFGGYITRILLI